MSRDGFAAGLGRFTPGDVISDRDGNLTHAVTGAAVTPPDAPARDAGRPQFSKEDLEHIKAEPDAPEPGLTAEEVAEFKDLLARKIYSPEELQRHHGLTDAHMAQLTAPAPSRASAETRLSEIRAMRKAGDKAYWSAPIQAEELRLIEQVQVAKSGTPDAAAAKAEEKAEDAKPAETAEPSAIDEIEAELKKIADFRKADRRAYDKDEALQAREQQLIAALEDSKEAARVHEQGTAVVQGILDEMPDAEAFDASFMGVVNAMSEESQEALRMGLATPVESIVVRPATAEQIDTFAALGDEAAQLVKSWGARGAQKLGQVHARIDTMMAGLSDADHERAGAWIDALTPEQRVGVVRGLAGSR